ncbi:MAG: VacJ family lipoprotein [Candidatus Synoicihabitans palmerolidicus]|nr:VacJ family lipoprotein [Candidatus Synoicihabitans palmerolidicus]
MLLLCLLTLFAAARTAQAAVGDEADDWDSASPPPVSDPWQGFNRAMFKFNHGVITHALRPLNRGYETVMPRPVR